ncbi:hypothetical protein LCGC14_0845510 [marine sediment metagenome]|uniref:Uncharacterized protein n=1 Tax=marine sediment metagenome TaxID=412755 RepID=A0A0F9PBV5_9ZZZZ
MGKTYIRHNTKLRTDSGLISKRNPSKQYRQILTRHKIDFEEQQVPLKDIDLDGGLWLVKPDQDEIISIFTFSAQRRAAKFNRLF